MKRGRIITARTTQTMPKTKLHANTPLHLIWDIKPLNALIKRVRSNETHLIYGSKARGSIQILNERKFINIIAQTIKKGITFHHTYATKLKGRTLYGLPLDIDPKDNPSITDENITSMCEKLKNDGFQVIATKSAKKQGSYHIYIVNLAGSYNAVKKYWKSLEAEFGVVLDAISSIRNPLFLNGNHHTVFGSFNVSPASLKRTIQYITPSYKSADIEYKELPEPPLEETKMSHLESAMSALSISPQFDDNNDYGSKVSQILGLGDYIAWEVSKGADFIKLTPIGEHCPCCVDVSASHAEADHSCIFVRDWGINRQCFGRHKQTTAHRDSSAIAEALCALWFPRTPQFLFESDDESDDESDEDNIPSNSISVGMEAKTDKNSVVIDFLKSIETKTKLDLKGDIFHVLHDLFVDLWCEDILYGASKTQSGIIIDKKKQWYIINETNAIWERYDGRDKVSSMVVSQFVPLVAQNINVIITLTTQKVVIDALCRLRSSNKARRDFTELIALNKRLLMKEDVHKTFDTNPHLLPFSNGVCYDFESKSLRAVKKKDYITLSTGYAWREPTSKEMETFQMVLGQIFTNEKERECYKSIMRLALDGNQHPYFIIASGGGSNGKSLIHETLDKILGGMLSKKINCGNLQAKRRGGSSANSSLAQCNRKRLIRVSEPEPQHPLNGSFIKELTGDSEIEARDLFQSAGIVRMSNLTIMDCNKIPIIPFASGEDSIRRRVYVFPFSSKFLDPDAVSSTTDTYNADNPLHFVKNTQFKDENWKSNHKFALFRILCEKDTTFNDTMLTERCKKIKERYLRSGDEIQQWIDTLVDFTDENDYATLKDCYWSFKDLTNSKIIYKTFKTNLIAKPTFQERFRDRYKGAYSVIVGVKLRQEEANCNIR